MAEQFMPLSACHLGGEVQTLSLVYDDQTRRIQCLAVMGKRKGCIRIMLKQHGRSLLNGKEKVFTAAKADGRRLWPASNPDLFLDQDFGLPPGLSVGAAWDDRH